MGDRVTKLKIAHENVEQMAVELGLLQQAIQENDPKSEVLIRINDLISRCARVCKSSCYCLNINMGSYANQENVVPPWGGRAIGIDRCIIDEIRALWDKGIRTIESCCGHNVTPGYIAVSPEHDSAMVELGYLRDPATTAPHVFLPRGDTLDRLQERVRCAEETTELAVLDRDRAEKQRDTAFLEGVKAGLEAAAEWADWLGAQYSVATDRGALIKPASSGIRAIDPATIKEPSDG